MELFGILILAILLVPVVVLTHGALRIVLPLLFLLFFPGYTLLAAILPRKDSLDLFERITLSFILSIAVVPLIGLVLNFSPLGIKLYSIIICIALFILLTSAISLYRRSRLPKEQRFEFRPNVKIDLSQWKKQVKLDKILTVALALSIIGAISVLIYEVTTPKTIERYSQFYIFGLQNMAADYPQNLILGESTEVTVGVLNQEHQDTTYHVQVTIDGQKIQEIGPINLTYKQKWEGKITIFPGKAGANQKVEFSLYKGEGGQPYLNLHLWLNVNKGET